jgi:hypothetical protein
LRDIRLVADHTDKNDANSNITHRLGQRFEQILNDGLMISCE